MIIPTRRFWALVALGLPVALAGAVAPGIERALIPYNCGLVVAALISAWVTPRSADLTVRRKFDQVLSVRTANRISLLLENHSPFAIRGRIREVAPADYAVTQAEFPIHLPPNDSTELHYHATPQTRGTESFGDVFLRILGPLGLVEVERMVPAAEPSRVYPNVLALREFDLLKQRGRLNLMGIRKSRIRGQGTEFESLRDYHDDDYRRIDWKTTARRGKLVVRDYETERNQAVIVCVDLGRTMLAEVNGVSKLDHALDASLMLLHAAASGGDMTGLLVFSDRVLKFIPPKKGRAHSGAIIDALHDLQAEPIEGNYDEAFSYFSSRWKRRSLVVVFTDAEDVDQAHRLSAGLSLLRRRHLVMVARVADPRVKELLNMPLSLDTDLYRKSAALWYTSERKRAEIALQNAGVQNIDSEPEELAQALVSAYLIAKETSAI